MRAVTVIAGLALVATGCGRSATVSGTLQDEGEVDAVWLYGDEARAEVEADSFRLEGLRGRELDLRFTSDDGVHARMDIRDVPSGARVRLLGVWIEDGIAYPSRVEVDGEPFVTVNGIRMGSRDDLPDRVDERGVLLAADRSGDALLVRPLGDAVPDLRVLVTPGTEIVSPDGDPVPEWEPTVGDTLRVAGATESGYLVAAEITVPREAAVRDDAGEANGGSGGDGEDSGDGVRAREREDEGPGRGRGRGRGRGNGG